MKHIYIALLMGLALASCKNPEPQNEADAAEQETTPAGQDGFAETAPPNTEVAPVFAPSGRIAPQDTDNDESVKNHIQTGTDTLNNDDSTSSYAASNHLYSTHDKYHQVTCWYMVNNEWAISCLPDSQVANVKE